MEVQRGVEVSRTFAEAMGKMTFPSDSFTCPESEQDWHRQIVSLLQEQGRTRSAKLTALLQEEIDEILATKTPTKVGVLYVEVLGYHR